MDCDKTMQCGFCKASATDPSRKSKVKMEKNGLIRFVKSDL